MPSITVSFVGRPGSVSGRVRDLVEERGWVLTESGSAGEHRPPTITIGLVLAEADESPETLTARLSVVRCENIPVLVLAEPGLVEALRKTWRCGIDDFASPDASQAELAARLAILAHGARRQDEQSSIQLGNVVFDRTRRLLYDDEREVRLTSRECVLLEALADFSGAVVSREDLAERVWGQDAARSRESNVLEVYINYLRKKLALLGAAERLRTVRGIGYALTAGESATQPTSS